MKKSGKKGAPEKSALIENLKKGITEMLVLNALDIRPMYIYELIQEVHVDVPEKCRIAYPDAAFYRLIEAKYITEAGKKNADDRLRTYYKITEKGRAQLNLYTEEWYSYSRRLNKVFTGESLIYESQGEGTDSNE